MISSGARKSANNWVLADEAFENSSSNESSTPRNMAWTTLRESFHTAYKFRLEDEPQAPLETAAHDSTRHTAPEHPRGRSLARSPRSADPFSRSINRHLSSAIEVKATSMGKRISRSSTFHDYPTSSFALLDDNVLEPCPHISQCATVSEVLTSTVIHDPMDIDAVAHSSSSANKVSDAQILAAEILEQIYYHLAPADFYAARHTCRDWFIKSMERGLLEAMCKRCGVASSIQKELAFQRNHFCSRSSINEEWLMSKRLSRECALGAEWKGNGLTPSAQQTSPFQHASSIEFAELEFDAAEFKGTVYTVSTCGQFLITANGCLVYVYELRSRDTRDHDCQLPSLRPVTSIICPARVLACSMDTSSDRYAVAVLLEGRLGMVCDITALKSTARQGTRRRATKRRRTGTPGLDRVIFNSSGHSEQPFVFPGIATTSHQNSSIWQDRDLSPATSTTSGSRHGSISRSSVLSQSRADKNPTEQSATEAVFSGTIPIENGPRSLYRNICSADDPPRSVSHCSNSLIVGTSDTQL